jgi:hypothetical protein
LTENDMFNSDRTQYSRRLIKALRAKGFELADGSLDLEGAVAVIEEVAVEKQRVGRPVSVRDLAKYCDGTGEHIPTLDAVERVMDGIGADPVDLCTDEPRRRRRVKAKA